MESCLFCKIAKGEVGSVKVFENENIFAFNDINPKAKIHILIIPKNHIESIKHLQQTDIKLAGEILLVAKEIADVKNMSGYKLIFNVGREGGQDVSHLHVHLLSADFKGVI